MFVFCCGGGGFCLFYCLKILKLFIFTDFTFIHFWSLFAWVLSRASGNFYHLNKVNQKSKGGRGVRAAEWGLYYNLLPVIHAHLSMSHSGRATATVTRDYWQENVYKRFLPPGSFCLQQRTFKAAQRQFPHLT